MPADMLIYGPREPKPPFQSWNEPLINKVKTSEGVCLCVCVCVGVWKAAWWITAGSFHFVVMEEALFSKKHKKQQGQVRFDTIKDQTSKFQPQICLNVIVISWQHENHSKHSKVNEGTKFIRASPVSDRVLRWVKPNYQSEITPNIQR